MKILFVILATVVLVGCAGRVEYVDRPVYITKYRTIDAQYLLPCTILPPPDAIDYMASSAVGREEMWVDTYTSQVSLVAGCNKKMAELRELNQYLNEQYNADIETE